MIDLLALRRFIIVCEEMSFSRAAERIGVSQPAVTSQINAIERELGLDLIVREQQRILALTAAGRSFLVHARAIIGGLDEAVRSAQALTEQEVERVRIGVCEESASRGFVQFYQRCRRDLPDIAIDIREFMPGEITDALISREIDLAFAIEPPAGPCERRDVWQEGWGVVLPVGHDLAQRDSFTLEDIHETGMILAQPAAGGAHELLRRLFTERKLTPPIVRQARRRSTILALAAAGEGITVLIYAPKVVVNIDGAVVRPLAAPAPWVTMLSLSEVSATVRRVMHLAGQMGGE